MSSEEGEESREAWREAACPEDKESSSLAWGIGHAQILVEVERHGCREVQIWTYTSLEMGTWCQQRLLNVV